MIGNGPQFGYRVPAKSVGQIRSSAQNVSKILAIGDDIKTLDIGVFLDGLSEFSITYDIFETADMPHKGVEACCIPEQLVICIREDVYRNACYFDPRARFTVMHEFGHLILGHQRTLNREDFNVELKTYEDSEWQADQFAAEFLMPYDQIKALNLKTMKQIYTHFNVSEAAAHRRFNQLSKRGEI